MLNCRIIGPGFDGHILGRQSDDASFGHCIASVDTEIDHDLMKLSGIANQWPKIFGETYTKLNRFRESVSEDFGDFLDQMARLKEHALAFDSAREGQHL